MPRMPGHAKSKDASEDERLLTLAGFWIAGTEAEPRFDMIARLAADIFHAPMAFVTLVERNRQWFKSCIGIDARETPREISFCTHTIRSDEIMVVPDAADDPRFAANPLVVGEPRIRFYAGAPLIALDGHRLGSLCVADTVPRDDFGDRERHALRNMAALVMEQVRLRKTELVRSTVMNFADATELALLSVDAEARVEFINRAALELFGYSRREIVGRPVDILLPDRSREGGGTVISAMAGGEPGLTGKTVELTARKQDGREFPAEMSLSLWKNERGIGMGAIIRDISERRERDARLLQLASQDTLTGLCNRRHFDSLVTEALGEEDGATVILIDLDGFKDVNDSLGHAIGDALLQAVAARLPAVLEDRFTVARFGGDEFAVLLPSVRDPLKAQAVAHIILRALEAPFGVAGHIFHVGGSLGFSIAPHHGQDAEEIIASADFALYRAKQAGGNTARIYQPEMRAESVARRATQDELLRALEQDELVLHYQPQISLRDGTISGMEALLRWQHPERGLLYPDAFLPALEVSALALPVGWWVLDEACRQVAAWRALGLRHVKVGVNLFPAQFRANTLVQIVVDTLERHGLPASALELEVTETIALSNDDHAFMALRALQQLGVGIAFDDFGTGYASLSSLQRFPLTTLKIDRGFVRDMLTNSHDEAITRAMIAMGNDLGLETIAEGVETPEQAALLKQLGCRSAQGYIYGRPMPAATLATMLNTQHPRIFAPLPLPSIRGGSR